jgi:ribonuclease Z
LDTEIIDELYKGSVMSDLIILGSASAVPDKDHENTHFVLTGERGSVLVDCVGSPIIRLERAGIDLDSLNDIILTHCHPDHISGIPSLLMSLWLMGRRVSLNIYGLHHTLDCIERMMGLYEWGDWPDFFPVAFHRLPTQEMTLVLDNEDFRIFSSPVKHIVPTIGLRIESIPTGKVIAYSCDTEPCPQVVRLGKDADILIHEATGQSYGHSSSFQAGEVASDAGAKILCLIHYPSHLHDSQDFFEGAGQNFLGEIKLAEDFMKLSF